MNSLWDEVVSGKIIKFLTEIEGTQTKVPVTIIGGTADGPSVLITTGIHGSEFPATAAAIELGSELQPADIKGRLIMLHPVNTRGFQARVSMIMPEDGFNLNRAFPGDPEGRASFKLAWWLTGLSDKADFYLDLHSGDLYEELTPYVYYPGNAEEKVVETSRAAAMVLDMPYMVRSGAATGAYNSAALRGTPSLLLERGGAGFCRDEEIALYKQDIRSLLIHLGMMSGQPTTTAGPRELTKVIYLESKYNACWRSAVSPGQKLEAGMLLGRTFDFFGNIIAEYRAEMEGVVLYQLYPLSTNPGDVLVAYGA